MYQTLVVIDDFLDIADEIRSRALAMDYPVLPGEQYFPGRNSAESLRIQGMDELISRIVGEPLQPAEGTSHGKFRLALEGERGKGGVHIDNCDWSGILYLSKDKDCQGGTDFYRHNQLNSDRAPLTKQDLVKMGLDNFESFWKNIMQRDNVDYAKWTLTTHIPMRYNRLILFRPWLFHDAGKSFGNTPENGRLIYPLFYRRAN
ncbi:hypothetical protein SAMN05216361_1024 [Marisediminitalea aggregata]|uniref:Phytanoyl-CoA dioxygenase (PhyH) n=1 Tax=Marisediminitalea aggregata TaxID=634436 RepID=A0A1M5GHS1_9ALTE|nr:DUF6445 family protein [Marisediminitalea aggregata]MAP19985.1 hypothetical protein [Alteromonadaceae bacterium]MEC7824667.1 DUF6445 family protein [Pseudomonadota bacterium]HBY40444.1 hypothetical protein [Alteromonas sp.]MAX41916.1 hypothetical protein [Alteromonadaceae bacterium]SHG03267.1 hypothetical protein SAMN05216361_1024 [Marisediminitalea aggregata]